MTLFKWSIYYNLWSLTIANNCPEPQLLSLTILTIVKRWSTYWSFSYPKTTATIGKLGYQGKCYINICQTYYIESRVSLDTFISNLAPFCLTNFVSFDKSFSIMMVLWHPSLQPVPGYFVVATWNFGVISKPPKFLFAICLLK